MELKEGIKQINQSVTQSSASDATLEGYMLELKDANGNLVDKQPVSKLENLVYNYLTTKRTGELATAVGRTKDFETAFGYNRGINFQRQSEPDTFFKINYNMCAPYGGAAGFVADIYIGMSYHPVDIYKFAIVKTTGGTKFSVYGNMSSIYPSNFYHDANNNIYINIKYGGDSRVCPIVGSVSSIEQIGTTAPEGLTEIPLSNAYASYMRDYPTINELAGGIAGQPVLAGVNDNVFIMFHRNRDDYPLMVKPDKWARYQNSGEIAEGVVVVEGGKILVVAPTETLLYWSSAAVSGGGKTTIDRLTALDDWTGKASTAAQITHAECSSASYAPGYCAQYSRVNANGKGLTAGRWWLPSLGELMMIYANMCKINYALSLIEGATQLAETWYWSSTEYNAAYAWYLYLDFGSAYPNAKATSQTRVRAVSAFIE